VHVVVVGAGIAGLAAAHELRRRAPHLRVTVVEGAGRIGGKLNVSDVGGRPVDEGAEMFLVRVPEAVQLLDRLGLAGQVVHPATTAAGVVVAGTPRPLPAGTVMGVPARAEAVRGVLGDAAARAVAGEPDLPGEPLAADVPVGAYVRQRLGAVFVDRLVDPLLGGVYAGRADLLSLQATVPALFAALRQQPSLVRAAAAAQRPDAGGPVFGTLPQGLGTLPAAVLAGSGAQLLLRCSVREIHRTAGGFRLVAGPVPDPTYLAADAVVVAAPAGKAGAMLRTVAPAAATELSGIDYASMAIVTVAYPPGTPPPPAAAPLPGSSRPAGPAPDEAGVAGPPAGSGLLVPAVEGRAVKALTYSSAKWAHLSAGPLVLRASVGRYGEAGVLHRDDADLVGLVLAEVAALAGISAPPLATRVTRWGGALPQYAVGHTDRVRRIQAAVAAVPGLAVCGAAYEGVGVPACIRSAHTAVGQVLAALAESEHGTNRR
jgi:protoporphyrinogen/coproporphyrinogen III oxidase